MNFEDSLRQLEATLIDKLVARAMTEIVLASSFFLTPGINKLTAMAVRWLITKLIKFAELRAYFIYIEAKATVEAEALKKAIEVHKENPNEKTQADLIDAARKLLKLRT